MTQPQPRLSDSEAYLRLVGDADDPIPTQVDPPGRRPPWAWIGVGLAVLAIAALFYIAQLGSTATDRADATGAQLDVTAARAEDLAARIGKACRDGAVPIPYQGACAAAQDVTASDLRAVPAATNGTDGSDGTDGIDGIDGVNGTNGVNGTDGTDGEDGTDGADGAAGAPGLGVDGTDGVDGTNGIDGTNGRDGERGPPGIGIRSSEPDPADRCRRLVTYDDGRTESWGPFCEPTPTPGPPPPDDPPAATQDPPPIRGVR